MSKFKRMLCALLCVCMISLPTVMSVTVANAEDVSSLEQQLQELDKKNDEYQEILEQTKSDINKKEAYKEALVSKVEVLDDKIEVIRQKIEKLNKSIEKKQKDIDTANQGIEDQLDALSNRLRILYMSGNATNLEIILGAKDFSDLIDKMDLVKTLSNCDKELIDGIKVKLEAISAQKKDLEADKTEVVKQQTELEDDQKELSELIAKNDEILRTLYASSDDAQAALEQAATESQEIQDKIKAYYAEQLKQAQQNTESNNGGNSDSNNNTSDTPTSGGSTVDVAPSGYAWPCPGYYYLTSPYEEQRTGYCHGGIDIGAGMGATVVAADDGYVFASNNSCPHNWGKYGSCGCGGGYGNYVMIDHGNGKTTVYGHFTNIVVSAGQHVSKGQTIGYVGSTGNSTGPHLHFECQLYGVKYDPMDEY